jgi:hypothetical protein
MCRNGTAMFYPGNYGFVPHTLAEDGDPIDVLIVGPVSVVPSVVVRCRPVGALLMVLFSVPPSCGLDFSRMARSRSPDRRAAGARRFAA